jgi:CRP-like cAMP-binding protein
MRKAVLSEVNEYAGRSTEEGRQEQNRIVREFEILTWLGQVQMVLRKLWSQIQAYAPPEQLQRITSVAVDNERGARLAAKHLIQLGHKRIALVGGHNDLDVAKNVPTERAKGFLLNAQTLAQRSAHQRLTPEHLLKVLLDDAEGMAAGLIRAAGGDPSQAMRAVDAALAKQAKVEGSGAGQVFMAPETGKVFEQAEEIAKKAGDSFVTVERSELVMIPVAVLREQLQHDGSLALAFARELARATDMAAREILNQKLRPASERLASLLLREHAKAPDSNVIAFSLSKRKVALRLGATPETLSRELHALAAQGLIESRRTRVRVLDAAGLAHAAEHGVRLPRRRRRADRLRRARRVRRREEGDADPAMGSFGGWHADMGRRALRQAAPALLVAHEGWPGAAGRGREGRRRRRAPGAAGLRDVARRDAGDETCRLVPAGRAQRRDQ